jgi:Arc/MetJ-type ribon-helix-helix transcriptional regulator
MQNTRKSLVQVSFRIPKTLKEVIEQYVKSDLHVNASDFFREALREKIQRDAPELYKALVKHG